jgi:hypothetical protein
VVLDEGDTVETVTKKPRLRFKRQPNETGLARVCQRPPAHELWYGDKEIGAVSERTQDRSGTGVYYWYCATDEELGIEYRNTVSESPYYDLTEAKADFRSYVELCLKTKGLR